MNKIKQTDMQIISYLRHNGRMSLTSLARKTKVAHSTIFDRLHSKRYYFITRPTILLDFRKLGFFAHAHILLAVDKQEKQQLIDHLLKHQNVNSLFKINNGWDVMMECVFKDMQSLESFLDLLDTKFKIRDKQIHYVIEELKRERFLTDPSLAEMMLSEITS